MPSRRSVLRALGPGTVLFAGCASLSDSSEQDTSITTDTATVSSTATETAADTSEEQYRGPACETSWEADPLWTVDELEDLGVPTATTERLFLSSENGLVALDSADGSIHWQQSKGSHAYTVAGGIVLSEGDDRILAVDAGSGEELWTFAPPGEYARWARTIPVYAGTVYLAAAQVPTPERDVDNPYGRLYGLDLRTGEQSFVRDLTRSDEEWVEPDYVVAGDAGVFLTLDRGGLLGLDHHGAVRWWRTGDDWYYRPVLSDDRVLQPTSSAVVAVDAQSGETQWQDHGPEMHVAATDGVVYGAGGGAPDEDGVLAALDAATGQHQWDTVIQGCGHRPAVGSGVVALPVGCRDGSGHVSLFDTETGCRYGRFERTPSPVVSDGRLYASVGDTRERLVAFDLP